MMKQYTTLFATAVAVAIATATVAIRRDEHARLADALKPSEMPAAALLESDTSVSLADYAVIGQELEWAGDVGRAAVLSRHNLTETEWTGLGEIFYGRMVGNRALVDYYEAHAFRVARGRFAAYGQDLADSYEKGQELKLDPPFPIADISALTAKIAAIWKVANTKKAQKVDMEAQALRRYGLSHYDYTVVNGWWLRKALVAEMRGDHSIMRAFTDAEAASVRIGEDEHIGSDVTTGGRPVEERSGKR